MLIYDIVFQKLAEKSFCKLLLSLQKEASLMKKAITYCISVCIAGGIVYLLVQNCRNTNRLANRYPGLSIYGQIKKGRI